MLYYCIIAQFPTITNLYTYLLLYTFLSVPVPIYLYIYLLLGIYIYISHQIPIYTRIDRYIYSQTPRDSTSHAYVYIEYSLYYIYSHMQYMRQQYTRITFIITTINSYIYTLSISILLFIYTNLYYSCSTHLYIHGIGIRYYTTTYMSIYTNIYIYLYYTYNLYITIYMQYPMYLINSRYTCTIHVYIYTYYYIYTYTQYLAEFLIYYYIYYYIATYTNIPDSDIALCLYTHI